MLAFYLNIERQIKAWVLKEQFINSKSHAIKKGMKQVNGNFNIFAGQKRKGSNTSVQFYEDIDFSNIYPNIDLKLSHKGDAVEKIFMIDKGGNPSNIDIKIDGALSLEVNDLGELVVQTDNQSYSFSKPIAWQGDNREKEIKVEYWVEGTEYGFKVGEYNKNETLYIDPEIVSTYLGGMTTYTSINDIATDGEGNIYVAGSVKYNSYPVTAGAYDITFDGGDDGIISKFNNNLTQILSSTFISGTGAMNDSAIRVRINDENNVVVGLETNSASFPVTQSAYDKTYNGGQDVALAIFSNNLSELKYASYIGGSGRESLRDIQFDQFGNIVFGGSSSYSTTNYPTTLGAYQSSNKGGADAYISVISKDLSTLVSSTLLGEKILYDYLTRIAIKSNGDIVISGGTENVGFPTTSNAYDRTYNGGLTDMFLSIFDSNLTALKSSTLLGGNNGTAFEIPSGLNILPDGNIVVTGYTQASNFPVTTGAFDTSFNGADDGIVSVFNHDLSQLVSSTFIGGSGSDAPNQLDIDSTGLIYIAGGTGSANYPVSADAFDKVLNNSEIFITTIKEDLSKIEYSTFIGGSKADSASTITVGRDGAVYLSGGTSSLDFPVTQGAIQTKNYTHIAFVLKLPRKLSGLSAANWVKLEEKQEEALSLGYGGINLSQSIVEVFGGSNINFELNYNSILLDKGAVGIGWTHNYETKLIPFDSGNIAINWNANRTSTFSIQSDGTYAPNLQFNPYEKLVRIGDEYYLYDKALNVFVFNAAGNLIYTKSKNGIKVSLQYDIDNRLTGIADELSQRGVQLVYNSEGFVSEVEDTLGRNSQFFYDTQDRLIRISDAEGYDKHYEYNEKDQLTIIKDHLGNAIHQNAFDDLGRITSYDDDPTTVDKKNISYIEDIRTKQITTTLTDEIGNTTVEVYNAEYELLQTTNALNKATTFEYDKFGNIVKSKDANGFETYFSWDSVGNLVNVTDQNNRTTAISYDANKNPLSITNANNEAAYYEYDSNNNVVEYMDYMGNVTTCGYDENGLLNVVTKPLGGIISIVNENGLSVSITPNGTGTVSNTYDAAGRKISQTDGLGNITQFFYNSRNQITKVIDALNGEENYSYNHRGLLASFTDKNQNVTEFRYDNYGNLIQKEDALNGITSFTYDEKGNMISQMTPMGNLKHYEYNALNQLISERDYYDNEKSFYYDLVGNLIKIVDAESHIIFDGTYDAYGNLVLVKDGMNRSVTNNFDALNRMITSIDDLGRTTAYNYDSNSKLTSAQNALGNFSYASYDADGNRVSVTDQNSNVTQFTFDLIGRLTSITNASGNTKTFAYDNQNLIETIVNGRQQSTSVAYDSVGRIINLVDAQENAMYSYDAIGNLLTVESTSGNLTRTYDALGRVTQYTDVLGNSFEYYYDADSRMTGIKYPDGKVVNYVYDNAGRLVQVIDWNDRTTTYSYDGNGRLSVTQRPDGTYQHNFYDASGHLSRIVDYNNLSQVINESQLQYNEVGNIIKETDLLNTVEKNNVFDFNNQLTSHQVVENSIPIANYSFSYDAGGNALTRELDGASKNFEYSTDNRISTVDSNSAQYDNDGNLVSITIDGVTKNFSYDSRNRLTGDSQATYSYDSEDRRISKIVGTDTTSYAIDPSERLSKVLVKTINGVSTYYVYGLGLISEETNADYKLYHFDYRGSTILLTDGTGQITDSYSYGPFGNVSNHTGTSDVDYLFLGQFGVITDENELVFMNDRYYAPYIGRFLNEDPYSLRYNDITNLNLYGYCGNDPINNVDPSGNFFETLFDIVNLAFSAKDFFSDPTVEKFATLAWDTAAAALPFIPGSYVKKGLSLTDDAFDLARSGSKTIFNSIDEGLNFAKTPAGRMENPGRFVPVQTLQNAIKSTKGLADPKGSDALMHYTEMFKNGKQYNLEVLYDGATNTVFHFKYTQEAIGPLKALK